MKRFISTLLCIVVLLALSGCPTVTRFPDMVEYTEEEILTVAKEKYGIDEWILTGGTLQGELTQSGDGSFSFSTYRDNAQFGFDFANGDNLVAALSAFAGKNGGHDIQGMYADFICYVALGRTVDGEVRYVYYNLNLHKDASIADTIGASDYTFEVLPSEITDKVFAVPNEWGAMSQYARKNFLGRTARNYTYSGERLSLVYTERYNELVTAEFYKENGRIVFDLYYAKDRSKPDERRLVYSSSDRYGVIYSYYGVDVSQYVDVSYLVEQSTEQESCMVLRGTATIKEVGTEILYSTLSYRAEYDVLWDGKIISRNQFEKRPDVTQISWGVMIDKIDGIDHTETARFWISDFYIFYQK